ncbi:MAG: hypothetical protein FJX72_02725 [Armatimonadetes bacterium]|nr:hypothetical protein [Armatimonadota bacterium]
MKAALTCPCGQRIFVRDVMQQGKMVRPFGPRFVYIRYRCSRCKRLGEHFIEQDQWDIRLLTDASSEASDDELRRFSEMGPITVDELQHVRTRLTTLRRLPKPGDMEIPTEQT